MEHNVDVAAAWIRDATSVTVLTGAGISTDSGIPDFRGPQGLWTTNPDAEKASTLDHYLNDRSVREFAWRNRVDSPAWNARPNAGHHALLRLETAGKLVSLITQNIDELHQRCGHDPAKVIEVHGTMWFSRCWTCADRRPMAEALQRVRSGESDPRCVVCSGVLKSDTISFGQALIPEVIAAALGAADACDVLIAAGSSLSVFPAANVVPRAKAAGAKVIIVNGTATKMDRFADALLLGQLSEILPNLCQ